jgi:hypothetical protein
VPKRDPHDVLGVPRGASQATIKAAWRRLARAHHPDVSGADPASARAATRRMAEINAAYEQLRVGAPGARPESEGGERPVHWPPKPRPSRPVTGRVDTTATYRARNTTTSGSRPRMSGPAPLRGDRLSREPLRASDPNGPVGRSIHADYAPPPPPPLHEARAHVITFGKFHGHTLGEIAGFEPSYIDWLAATISRDPDLVAKARAIRDDLDARGIMRRHRPTATPPGPR